MTFVEQESMSYEIRTTENLKCFECFLPLKDCLKAVCDAQAHLFSYPSNHSRLSGTVLKSHF